MVEMRASNTGDTGSIPGWGARIPHAARHGQKIKLKKRNKQLKKKKRFDSVCDVIRSGEGGGNCRESIQKGVV